VYRSLQTDAKVTSLISERDKVLYKAKVRLRIPLPILESMLTEYVIEKTPITRFLHQLLEWIRTLDARVHPRIRRISR
jgi:hypothetical protein